MSFLYDNHGSRKYITIKERRAFLSVAKQLVPADAATFCAALAHTGARISEVLELVPSRIDVNDGMVVVRSLKKRRLGVYRAVPVPTEFIRELDLVHSLQEAQADEAMSQDRIWPWSRTTAWQLIKQTMSLAGIEGPQATPKGLRHGFAISALQSGVPLNVVSKWLGHAHLKTTAIYADAVGEEERLLAQRMWDTLSTSENKNDKKG